MTDAVDVKIADLPAAGAVESGAYLPLVRDMGAAGLITQRATAAQIVESTPPMAHTHTKSEIGLSNVDNTADTDKPVSTAQRVAIDDKMAAHLADPARPHITLAQAAGAAPVQSVAGRSGNVTLTSADVGLGNVANLAPADLPLSDAAAAALASKMDVGASISTSQVAGLSAAIAAGVTSGAVTAVNGHTGNVTLSKADVGLANVANLAPADMPVSTATTTALAPWIRVSRSAGWSNTTTSSSGANRATSSCQLVTTDLGTTTNAGPRCWRMRSTMRACKVLPRPMSSARQAPKP